MESWINYTCCLTDWKLKIEIWTAYGTKHLRYLPVLSFGRHNLPLVAIIKLSYSDCNGFDSLYKIWMWIWGTFRIQWPLQHTGNQYLNKGMKCCFNFNLWIIYSNKSGKVYHFISNYNYKWKMKWQKSGEFKQNKVLKRILRFFLLK